MTTYYITVEPVKVGWDGVSINEGYDEVFLYLDVSYCDKVEFSLGFDKMGIPRDVRTVSKEEWERVAKNAARYNPTLKANLLKYGIQ